MPKRILFDTDPGIDDACAILLALASPELSLEGVSLVHGNCSVDQATINALSILELADAGHVPVARGCELPLVQPPCLRRRPMETPVSGTRSFGNRAPCPSSNMESISLIEKILSSPGEITLVAIGPLTNVALAIRQEPRLIQAVREVIVMGGAIRYEGNTTALAEFNTYVDQFYIPLALTSLILLICQPIGSAAISRMPAALASLAVWPVVSGLIFMLRSPGIAYNEVVVALLDEPFSYRSLLRFSILRKSVFPPTFN